MRLLGLAVLIVSEVVLVGGCAGDAALSREGSSGGDNGGAGTPSTGSGSGGSSVMGSGGGGNVGTAGSATPGADAGGIGIVPGVWHGAKSSRATDATLQQEYALWKMRNVLLCANGSAAVKRDAGSVVSEGIGYGMLLSAALGDRALFDALFQYYNDHLDPKGLMNWAAGLPQGKCEPPGNNNANAATDGDLDTAMALVQADGVWPGSGYLAKAQALAAKILANEVVDCPVGNSPTPTRATLRPGDAWGACTDPGSDKVNPSYFAPGYYRVFAARFSDQAARWSALLQGTYELHTILQQKMSGLVPDWSDSKGSNLYGAQYGYEACRTPWRIAVDYAWSGDDRSKTFLQAAAGWVDAHGGLPNAAQEKNSAFIGGLALTGIYDQSKLDVYIGAWLGANTDDTPYYQGTLRLLYLLVAAGKFPSTI